MEKNRGGVLEGAWPEVLCPNITRPVSHTLFSAPVRWSSLGETPLLCLQSPLRESSFRPTATSTSPILTTDHLHHLLLQRLHSAKDKAAMTGSKSPQTVRNIVIVVLALWSVISLIIIVVWATSPDMKSSVACSSALREAKATLEGERVVWGQEKDTLDKDKLALEHMVQAERDARRRERSDMLLVLAKTNATLDECSERNLILRGNITELEQTLEQLRETRANLTAHIALQDADIAELKHNRTVNFHNWQSCLSDNNAAQSSKASAESATQACLTTKNYLDQQLINCKQTASQQTAPNSAVPHASVPTLLLLLLSSSLRLIT